MRVALNKLENYPNLALEKIRIYHQSQGDEVEEYIPLMESTYDKIYCSSIFTFTPKPQTDEKWVCGGTGFDLTTNLPAEIDNIKPKLNYGFTSRGCIRKCPFCVVPEKEGNVHAVGDIYDLWDGKSKDITLFDNNILALPEHFTKICEQVKAENLKVDFNQGLDIRLLKEKQARVLRAIRVKEYRFAFDDPNQENLIRSKVELLKSVGIKKAMFYVLAVFSTTFTEDLHRLNVLRELGQNAYLMRYIKKTEYIPLARWANQQHLFRGMTYEQFLELPANSRYSKERREA